MVNEDEVTPSGLRPAPRQIRHAKGKAADPKVDGSS